jgi:tripartite-type tricarboxylate transporter receptor subunit TctC
MTSTAIKLCIILATTTAMAAATAARAADFYAGKTIDLVVSNAPGGGFDIYARTIARHMSRHIPGQPVIVVKNMPGAGHIRAANYVFTQAPKDGTTIATFIPIFVMAQVLERSRSIQFNSAQFNWLGSTSSSNSTVYVWHSSGVKSVEDATRRTVVMGGTGAGSYTIIYPTVMNSLIGTRFKVVTGYQSTAEVGLAMERGEIEGRAGNNFNSLKAENGEWLRTGKINLIAQVGLARDPEFPQVPLLTDFAKNDDDRRILRLFSTDVLIGRPFVTSPGVPPERVALLRRAFDAMMKDPAYVEDSRKANLDVSPTDGATIQSVVADLVGTPDDIVAKAKLAMEPKDLTERPR